jgi:hypothetical protein
MLQKENRLSSEKSSPSLTPHLEGGKVRPHLPGPLQCLFEGRSAAPSPPAHLVKLTLGARNPVLSPRS